MPRLFPLAALATLLVGAASAQPLTTDRPDFTESPSAVAPGRFQVEFGTTLASFSPLGDIGTTELTVPEALVRIGVLPGIEARVTAPDYVRLDTEAFDVSADGFSDPSVGVKAEVGTFGGVAVGLIAQTTLPLGDEGFSDDRLVPSAILTVGGNLTETVSFGGQVEGAFFGEDNAPFSGSATIGATAVLGLALNEQAGAFAELVLEDEIGGAIDPYALVHTGATLLLTPDAQVDVHAGIGLAGYAPDYLVGVGASVRI